jgi:hypothetical protein
VLPDQVQAGPWALLLENRAKLVLSFTCVIRRVGKIKYNVLRKIFIPSHSSGLNFSTLFVLFRELNTMLINTVKRKN